MWPSLKFFRRCGGSFSVQTFGSAFSHKLTHVKRLLVKVPKITRHQTVSTTLGVPPIPLVPMYTVNMALDTTLIILGQSPIKPHHPCPDCQYDIGSLSRSSTFITCVQTIGVTAIYFSLVMLYHICPNYTCDSNLPFSRHALFYLSKL